MNFTSELPEDLATIVQKWRTYIYGSAQKEK